MNKFQLTEMSNIIPTNNGPMAAKKYPVDWDIPDKAAVALPVVLKPINI